MTASGTQYTLRAGDYEARLASVGATLRSLTHRDRNLVLPFDAHVSRPAMSGALLAPWPNRTADGRYLHEGHSHQLAISEPSTRTAAHGLVAWLDFDATQVGADRVTFHGSIIAQPGYPWWVSLEVEYRLGSDGLRHRVRATNRSSTIAPLGLGAHPYLVAGPPAPRAVDHWELSLDAGQVLLVTEDRMLPTEVVPVASPDGQAFDFTSPRRIGEARVNHAFTELRRGKDGWARVRLVHQHVGVELLADSPYRWIQVYTSDGNVDGQQRNAVAVEPMTCPPDALNSGTDLISLAPGETVCAIWRIRAVE